MNDQQPKPQQFSYPSNQGGAPTHFANTPLRQFKSPLPLPPPYEQQQNSQIQWDQLFSQQKGQRKQPQWPLLPRLLAYPQSHLPHLPSRHSKRVLWLILGIVALVVLFATIGVGSLAPRMNTTPYTSKTTQVRQPSQSQPLQQPATEPASQPTAIPTQAQAPKWATTHTFTGAEETKTNTFIVGDTWKIIWTCNPDSIFGGFGVIVVNIFSSDGTFQRGVINDTCKAGHTTGNTIVQQGGNIYLDITGGGSWTIQVQELK